jgi:PAS domain S-box-containing protein
MKTPEETQLAAAAGLRQRAQERLALRKPPASPPPSDAEAIHELQVHQTELELQNEELRRAQAELAAARARYFDLYDLAPVGYVTVTEPGLFLEANQAAAVLLGVVRSALVNRRFTQFILQEDQGTYYQLRKQLLATGALQAGELRLLKEDGTPFWAHLTTTAAPDEAVSPVCRIVLSANPERQRAEAAFHASEVRYRTILQTAMDGFWLADPQGRLLAVNAAYCQMSGYSSPELLAMHIPDLEAVEAAADTAAHIHKIMAQGEDRFETRHRRKDGSVFTVEISVQYQPTDGGRFVAFLRDITARQRAEAALLDAHWRLASIIEGTHVGTWEWNVQTGAVVFNERWAEIVGYTLAELAPISIKTWARLAHPEDMKQSAALLERHFAGELPDYDWECRMQHKAGHWVWVHDRGRVITRTSDGQPLMMFGTHTDITERKQTEAALQASNELLTRFIHHSPIYAYIKAVTPTESLVLQASDNFQQMIGSPDAEIVGKTMAELFPADLAAKMTDDDWTVVTKGEVLRVDEDLNGRHYSTIKFPIVQGDKTLLAGYTIDVTERHRAEEALLLSRQQLRALSAHLETLREEERTRVAREIHDVLAQELTRLKMDAVWLSRRLARPLDADQLITVQERLVVMTAVTDTAIQSVQKIATELRPVVLDSLGLCAAVEWQARDFQTRTGIACAATVPEQDLPLDRDRSTAVFRIVQESLTNVLRHAQATQVEILLRPEADQLVLRIQDNGCGIPPETLSDPRSIGLAGMRERALFLDGQLDIRSQPGAGTTIAMRLPLMPPTRDPEGKS